METPSQSAVAEAWSRARLAPLCEEERTAYEQACDQAEAALRDGQSIAATVAALQCPPKLLSLVLLNIGKCLLEQWTEAPTADAIDKLLADLLHLDGNLEAQAELRAFAQTVELVPPKIENTVPVPPSHDLVARLPSRGMAELFVVRRKSLDRMECLKAVDLSRIYHPELAARIKDEAVRASKISHPGLVQVYDAGVYNTHGYICMEYMNGGSLADRIATGPLPWQTVVRWLASVARALDALHTKARLAHGDIKPANLLFTRTVDGDEAFKIADFGLSSELLQDSDVSQEREMISAQIEKKFVFGTPGYLAPELLSKDQVDSAGVPFDERLTADIFSLGVTAYEAITGCLPYQTGKEVDPYGVLRNPYVPLEQRIPGVPAVVSYVVRRACSVDRKERYVSAKELARALEHTLVGVESSSPAISSAIAVTPSAPLAVPSAASSPNAQVPPKTTEEGTAAKPTRPAARLWAFGGMVACVLVALVAANSGGPYLEEDEKKPDVTNSEDSRPSRVTTNHAPKSIAPVDHRDSAMKLITSKGLATESAQAILELNRDWLTALRADTRNVKLIEQSLIALANIDESKLPPRLLQRYPHLAPLCAIPGVNEYEAFVRGIDFTEQREPCYLNLALQNPFRPTITAAVPSWVENHEAVAALMKHGMYGAEPLIWAGNREPKFREWVKEVLVERIAHDPDHPEKWLLIFLENQRALRQRLSNDEGFQQKFPKIWPRFIQLLKDDEKAAREFALNEHAWDVLAMDKGTELIQRYRLLAVAMFTGAEAFPSDQKLHAKVVDHLLEGYTPVVYCFANADLRKNPAFRSLILKPLPNNVFALACAKIHEGETSGKHIALAKGLAAKTTNHLIADFQGTDVDKWGAESLFPQLIYLRLAQKIVSGQSIYSVEIQRLFTQSVTDATIFLMPRVLNMLDIPKEQASRFAAAVPQVMAASDQAIRASIQREHLQALSKFATTENSLENSSKLQSQFHDTVKQCVETVRHQGAEQVVDITVAKRLFERLAMDTRDASARVDLGQVSFIRLTDGRLFPVVTTTEGVFAQPEVRKFFAVRTQILSANEKTVEEKENAWRQVVSAWILLGVNNQVPTTTKQ